MDEPAVEEIERAVPINARAPMTVPVLREPEGDAMAPNALNAGPPCPSREPVNCATKTTAVMLIQSLPLVVAPNAPAITQSARAR